MKLSETFWLTMLATFQNVTILSAVILYLRIPRIGRKLFTGLGWALIVTLVAEIFGMIGVHVFHTNMNLVYNIQNLFLLPLFVLFYRDRIRWKYRKVFASLIIIGGVTFGVVNMFFIQGPLSINSTMMAVSSLIITLMSMTYALLRAQRLPSNNTKPQPMLWINAGIVIYSIVTFNIAMFIDYLVNVLGSNLIDVLYFHHLFGITFYSLTCYGFIVLQRVYTQRAAILAAI